MCFAAGWNAFSGQVWPAGRSLENSDIDLWRGVVTAHHYWSSTPRVNGCGLTPPTRTQSSEQESSDLTTSMRHPSTLYSRNIPKAFHEEPGHILSEVNKTCVDVFGVFPGFLDYLLESRNLFRSATAGRKTALGVLQLWLHYFRVTLSSWHTLVLGG